MHRGGCQHSGAHLHSCLPPRIHKKPAKAFRMPRARHAGCLWHITKRPKLTLSKHIRRSYLLPRLKILQGLQPSAHRQLEKVRLIETHVLRRAEVYTGEMKHVGTLSTDCWCSAQWKPQAEGDTQHLQTTFVLCTRSASLCALLKPSTAVTASMFAILMDLLSRNICFVVSSM